MSSSSRRQWWCQAESICLPLKWLRFKCQKQGHVNAFDLAPWDLFPGITMYSGLSATIFPNFKWIRNGRQINNISYVLLLNHYSFIIYLISSTITCRNIPCASPSNLEPQKHFWTLKTQILLKYLYCKCICRKMK